MKVNKRLIAMIVELVIGTALILLSLLEIVDQFWAGMGTALIVVSVLNIFRIVRYKTNAQYRKSVEVEVNDERNKYISMKAWSWAGYLFVMVAAVATIVLKVLGFDQYMMICSGSVCIILVLYWISYWILRKKY